MALTPADFRAIVERHGGEVRVRSTPGVETVFELVLPGAAAPSARASDGGVPAPVRANG
jgi:nitrogen-specific signal transduction histidine kinase